MCSAGARDCCEMVFFHHRDAGSHFVSKASVRFGSIKVQEMKFSIIVNEKLVT